jgi:phosphatidylserine/phosphatidylglycerophosphate/cardiolipin synthase-like enzyme/membrane protein DedA with SNARE-associated domain
LLVDGEAYFSSLRRAAAQAKRSIFIIGWDVDSRTFFPPDGEDDGLPRMLGQFLNALVARSRKLHVYVLDWDFAFLYALDREILPIYSRGWRGHGRLHFRLDDCHPPGGSHHQKLVVLDDALAFVGGIDLTKGRWDTPRHLPDEPHRRTPSGAPYAPFHDTQLMVDGEAAAALGELARERWRCATGREPKSDQASPGDSVWPSSVEPHFEDVQVGIARTQPAYEGAEPKQEVLRLYLDGIRAAKRWIYIENQYFTAPAIGRAIEERLVEPNGPEIVIVTRLTGGGWLEQVTMEVLRARLIKRLQPKDRQGRLRVYFPDQAGLGEQCIDLHSKLMIVDDRLLRVGSSNLNNRSMGVDSECDLAIEAQGPQQAEAIASIRNRLLAEHLDVEPHRVTQELEQHGSLIKAIEALTGNARTLKTLEPTLTEEVDALVPDAETIDPEQPVDPERFVEQIVPHEERPRTSRRVLGGALVLLVVAALALAWRWGPLHEWLDRDTLRALAHAVERSQWTPLWMLGAYVVASLMVMPIMLLIVATALVFDPLTACAYAMAGSLLGATLTFCVGKALGHRAVRQIAGQRVNALSRRLGEGGVFAVMVVRILPIAPFTVVNVVAGASHLRMRDFLLGTALGMTPGIVAVAVFSDRLGAALQDPSPVTVLLLGLALVAMGLAVLGIRSWLRRHANVRAAEHR